MDFLRNAWYVAGFSDDIEPGAMLARTLLGEPILFIRDARGELGAIADRFPHRFAPLSMGEMRDGVVECRYHGLRFDRRGECVHNPHGRDGVIPKAACVRRYEIREQHGVIWWWAGDDEAADEAQIPDFRFLSEAPSPMTGGHLQIACDYRLLIDNILDLTHADFLHAGSLGSGAITRVRPEITESGPGSVHIAWHSSGDSAPPVIDAKLRVQGQATEQ